MLTKRQDYIHRRIPIQSQEMNQCLAIINYELLGKKAEEKRQTYANPIRMRKLNVNTRTTILTVCTEIALLASLRSKSLNSDIPRDA